MTQALSADGKTLVVANGNTLNLWDLGRARPTQPRTVELKGVTLQNAPVAFAPDSKTLAVASMQGGEDLNIHVIDTAAGKQVREIDNDQLLFGLAFSPDGRLLAVGTQQRVELWDAADGAEVRPFGEGMENGNFHQLTFSPDGKMLAGLGPEPDRVRLWEVASGKERDRLRLPSPSPVPAPGPEPHAVSALAFSADARWLAAADSDAMVLWDLQTGRTTLPLTGFRSAIGALAFTADGKELVAIDSEGTRLAWPTAYIRRAGAGSLPALAETEFADLWNDLAEADPFRIFRAQRHLAADPRRALPLLVRHLQPVPAGDAARLGQLVADLTNPSAGVRRKAMTELRTRHGEAALGALAELPEEQRGNLPIQVLTNKLQARYNTPERARALRAVRVLEEIGTPEARRLLDRLAKGAAGVNLTVEARAALDRLDAEARARRPEAGADAAWKGLADEDAGQAFRVMRRLCTAPGPAVALLRKHLKPAQPVDEKDLVRFVAGLESEDFMTREQATEELEKAGEQAVPALRKALAGKPSLEARKRIERLLERLTTQVPGPLLQSLRGVEVLEHVGTAEARRILQDLAGGAPASTLSCEARAALERLARRPSASP
jgi:hypothetical protein